MLATGLFAIFQKIIDLIGSMAGILFALLPASPFTFTANSQFADLISKINYFIPIYEITAVMEIWLVAIGIFYLYSLFARWLKAVE